MILYSAVVAPYGVMLPLNGWEKFACGSGTRVWPPSTTKPAMEIKTRVRSLTIPIPFDSQYEYFVWKERTTVGLDLGLDTEAYVLTQDSHSIASNRHTFQLPR